MIDFRETTADTILHFVREFLQEHHFSPSQSEIAAGCHLSRSTVAHYLDWLEAKGQIKRRPGKARSITLPNANSANV